MIKDKYIPRSSERHSHNWCVPYATAVVTGRNYDEIYKVFNDTLDRRGLVKGVKDSETHLVAEKYGIDLTKRYSVEDSHLVIHSGRSDNMINVNGYDGVSNIRNINKVVTALRNTKLYMEENINSGNWWFEEDNLWMSYNYGSGYRSSGSSPHYKSLYDRWLETAEENFVTRYYFVRISGHMLVYDYEKDLIIDNHSKKWKSTNDHVHRLKHIKELIPVIYTDDFVPAESSPRPTGVSERARLKKVYYNRVRRLCKKNNIEIVMIGSPKNWTEVRFMRNESWKVASMKSKTKLETWTPDWKVAYEGLKKFGWK